jgi:formylglycine-generating enzyme required for sulfatase activity
MSKIFISYRREESADVTGRIYDRLIQKFYRETVFKDVDSIPLGVDFRTYLDEQVAKCEVFLVVIGRDWMKNMGSTGKTRLDDPRDFVRIEIESALKRQIPVIPVLVSGVSIPLAEQLPTSIQDLSYRNGIAVRPDPDFHRDMDRLIEHLKQQVKDLKEHHLGPYEAFQSKQPIETQQSTPLVEPQPREMPVDMVKVPKGPFLYGEKRVHEVIDHDYWIDQYPVTNEKYRMFILANGYVNHAYWSVDGWKWKTENKVKIPEYWNDTTWNKADFPVVGVSYYEAEAYAKWAGKRLPTEQEWEKAARGEDGREYPWGDEFDKEKCNSAEAGFWHTTPVTQYPKGVSPYGCYDMAGNVWNWCANWYEDQKDSSPVLRGGSWYFKPETVRVSSRTGYGAGYRSYDLGFRLVQDLL